MTNQELIDLLKEIHIALDKRPLKGFGLSEKSWIKLSKVTGIKWPRANLTKEELAERMAENA